MNVRSMLLLATVVALASCSTSQVLVGKQRPPISADQVKIYLHAPAKYEEIALLEASSRNSLAMTQQGKMNKVISRLKDDAVALGANGILMQGTGSENVGAINNGTANAVVTGNTMSAVGFGTSIPIIQKTGSAIAIYVTEE